MSRSRTNSPAAELLVRLDREAKVPLHRQLGTAIREGVQSGRLPLGTALPPTRALAADLGVSRGVVVEAYQQLVAEGYLASRSGGYTEVAAGARTAPRPAPRAVRPAAPAIDFGYGRADVSSFPRAAWLRSIRRVLTEIPADRFGYLDGRGVPELHLALSDYLNRVRGTAATPDRVVVCNGYAQGLALLLQVLAAAGAKRIAVEDPSADDDTRPIAAALGMSVVGIPVGPDGIDVAELDRTHADALVLTPSHQWPTGGVLAADARAAVVRWANRTGALVIEDDYDTEYRYDRAPIGALQGLAPEQVAYAGTASKTLAPGLRLGWLVLPAHLVGPVAEAKVVADRGSPVMDQLAFADFLARGEFDRHLRRMRPVYRRRRDALLGALREFLPELEPAGISAGLHLVTWLPPDWDEAAVVATAAAHGVGIAGLAQYYLERPERGGLIFGYATLNEPAIRRGITRLAEVARDLPTGG
ncbi:PLP-dependent aminotransferase family protein [Amycolatopsis sp. 195334CR]|uniref:MocR-like pyridoxine biosynthesis transcription factor PdxR n=1 Tax=Amycolatopsis sp. 195334CR TaxID=2814588 RepID=UPI001A904402|nr:PLP-dependent aminotransferase family protein [Amycolatopsis sp. 195334CR]MBN6038256.1 PLP-dependent aminotransferase family protein [Amycolatopsis sp. 195334CR]